MWDCTIKNPKDIANAFNQYYMNITSSLNIKHNDMDKASTLLKNLKLGNIVVVQTRTIAVSKAEVVSSNKIP
jgi:hypothetical protein